MTAGYLFILLPIQVALLSVRVMLQELGDIRHDGFLIWLVYVNIYRETNWIKHTFHRDKRMFILIIERLTESSRKQNLIENQNINLYPKCIVLQMKRCLRAELILRCHHGESHALMELNYSSVRQDLSGFTVKGKREVGQMRQRCTSDAATDERWNKPLG